MALPDEIDAEAMVARARAEADAILARAEVEALAVKGRAEAEAKVVRARAQVEASELATRARNDREHAARLVADAQAEATAMLDEANEVRRGADGTIERLVATRRELESVIERLARLPHAVVDLTEDGEPAIALGDEAAPPAEAVGELEADALAEREVVPLGASVTTSVRPAPPVPASGVSDAAVEDDDTEDPVTRMVRSAIERAARSATESPVWSSNPAEQRESMRSNRTDLG
ncbi:MAG: hypothetical protein MUE36_02990 [Acidimicrobiales bacterium]|jgi:hypothetical protein|nr:hypothetical protein [Acidimicrobiales bacterium]